MTRTEYAAKRADFVERLVQVVDATKAEIEAELKKAMRGVEAKYLAARELHWLNRQCEIVGA